MGAVMNGMAAARRRAARSAARSSSSATTCAASVRLAALSRGQGHLLVDPRLGRPRRGRPDPPADRAPRVAAGHARPAGDPPGRRQRDRHGLARRRSTATGPTALILSRQNLPVLEGTAGNDGVAKGAYVLQRRRRRRPTSCSSAPAARSRSRSTPPSMLARRRHRPPGSCRCRAGSSSTTRTTTYQDERAARRRAHAVGRGRRHLRLGALGRRLRRHRPLRRQRPGRRRARRSSASTADNVVEPRPRAARPTHDRLDDRLAATTTRPAGGTTMSQAARPPRRAGPEPVARQPQARLDHRRRARSAGSTAACGASPRTRRSSRRRSRRGDDYDEQFARADRRRARSVERQLLGARHHRHPRRARHPAPGLRRQRRRRRLRLGRGRARAWPATPTARSPPPATSHDRIDEPNLYVKIPGTAEGLPAIQPDDRRGPQHQRHAALLRSSATPRSSRPTSPASRPPTGDLSTVSSVASFFVSRVDTEVDRRLDAIGTAEALAAQGQGRGRQRPAGLRAVPRALLRAPLGGARRPGRPRAAAAVGVDVDQEPATTPTRSTSTTLIGPDTVNTMPDATLDAFDDHGTVARTVDADLAGGPRRARRARPRSASTSTTSPGRSRTRAWPSFSKSFDELLGSLRDQGRSALSDLSRRHRG